MKHLLQLAEQAEALAGDEIKAHLVVSQEQALDWQGSILYDTSHKLHAFYGAAMPSLALIRPDGYKRLLSQPASEQALVAYLQRLFQTESVAERSRPKTPEQIS